MAAEIVHSILHVQFARKRNNDQNKKREKKTSLFLHGWKSGKTHAHLVHGLVAKKALGSQITAIYMW